MHSAPKVKDLKDAETNLELVDPFKWYQFASIYDSVQTLILSVFDKKESRQPLTLYTSFHDLINVYSRKSGVDSLRG